MIRRARARTSLGWYHRTGISALLIYLAGCAGLTAGTDVQRPMLNSERIKDRFGNYHVEVLHQSPTQRLSNLYSIDTAGCRSTRTLAYVAFALPIDERLQAVHQTIRHGASIGASLKSAGFQVDKTHHLIDTIPIERIPAIAVRLGEDSGEIAVHRYLLEARAASDAITYAEIVEVHDADYLTLKELQHAYPGFSTGVDRLDRLDAIEAAIRTAPGTNSECA